MATRFSRKPRRRRDTPAPIPVVIGGLLVVALLAVLGWQALKVYDGVPARDYSTIFVQTPQVGNLLSHDQVRIAGARVGQVKGRDVSEDGEPLLELQLEPGTSLPADTKVAVRGAGLLGARYVELIPGDSEQQVPEGATLVGNDDAYTFGLPETLDTFDGITRGALGEMVGGLGQGLLGHGEKLNDGIAAAGTRSKPFGQFAETVLRREGAAGRLVPALSSAVAPLDENRDNLDDLTSVTADAVEPFIDRRAELRATLDEAPPAFSALVPGLTAGSDLLRSARSAASQASDTLADAPRGVRSLNAMLEESDRPLERASDLLDAARPAVPSALRITSALDPVLDPLEDVLEELSPTLEEVDRYSCDIANFGTTMRSMTGFTQSGTGPLGPAKAFRALAVAPLSVDGFGVKDDSGLNRRESIVKPCTYLSGPYPQFVGKDAE